MIHTIAGGLGMVTHQPAMRLQPSLSEPVARGKGNGIKMGDHNRS